MKNVTQDYINAVTDYGREWQNTVVIKNGNVTETYTSCSINIEEVFSDSDTLSMGRAFSSKLSLKLYEPQRTLSYQDSVITVTSKLKVNNAFVDVSMGTFYPSEVITNDDYETLDIVAYDNMAKLDVTYEPRVTLPCTDANVIEDICAQYGLEFDGFPDYHQKLDIHNIPQTYEWDEVLDGETFKATLNTNYDTGVIKVNIIQGTQQVGHTKNLPLYTSEQFSIDVTHKYAVVSSSEFITPYIVYYFNLNGAFNYAFSVGNDILSFPSGTITNLSLNTSVFRFVTDDFVGEQEGTIQIYDLTEIYGQGNEPTTFDEFVERHGTEYHHSGLGLTSHLTIDTLYEGTVAETLGYMAGLVGKNAIFNSDNKLAFRWYSADTRYGSRWQDLLNIAWQDLDGTWATEFVDIINFDRSFQHQDGLSLNEGTFTINSITSGTADTVYTAGSGKGISFENPYITQELVNSIYANLPQDYKTFYVGTINTFGMPCAEVGDIVSAQMKDGEKRVIYISNNSWNLSGGCSCITSSVGVPNAEIEFSTESPSEKKLNKVRTALQGAITKATELINGARGGIFRVTDSNDDGVNDGWILSESETLTPTTKCIVANYEGIGLSSDGGQTMSDVAITHEGIVADAITSGQLTVGGQQNNVALSVIDTDGNEIGKWNKTIGLRSEKGVIGSMLQPGFGSYEPSGWEINTDAKNGLSSYCMSSDDNKLRKVYLQPYNNDDGDGTWIFSIQKAHNPYEWNPSALDDLFIVFGDGSILTHGGFQVISDSNTPLIDLSANGDGTFAGGVTIQGDASVFGDFSTLGDSNLGYNGMISNNLTVYGYIYGRLGSSSLEELKDNIEKAPPCLDIVKNADIYTFNYKKDLEDGIDKKSFGFVIGDKYETPEEVVINNEDGNPMAIDNYSMVSILWKAVQELSAKVDELENQVNGLEKGE